jgi:hypothetical protein
MQKSYIQSSNQASSYSHLVDTVGLALVRPTLRNSGSKVLEHTNSGVPVNASIGDGDTLLKAARALRGDLLVALVDVGLDHDTNDAGLAVADLVCDVLGDLGLVAVVLARIAWKLSAYYALSTVESKGWPYRESSQPS